MHSKIINPKVHGKVAYDNKSTSAYLVKYLEHEAKEQGQTMTFFNERNPQISAAHALERIDHNVKGLRRSESKFFALVLSPSPEELKHIANKPEKLKAFTIKAMENYAANFHLKNGKQMGINDLVWFATIHQDRTYKGTEPEVKEGLVKSGELKQGLNMHVHVIVSKRDREQKITLSPNGSKDRFCMMDWQKQNQATFEQLFDYRQDITIGIKGKGKTLIVPAKLEKMNTRIGDKVKVINLYLGRENQLALKQVLEIASSKQYSATFFYNLNRLENNLKAQKYVLDPIHLLEHNKDRKVHLDLVGYNLANDVKKLAEATRMMGFTENIALWKSPVTKRRKSKKEHKMRKD